MKAESSRSRRKDVLMTSVLLLLTATAVTYGRGGPAQDPEVTVKHVCEQVRPGIHQCMLYVEASADVLNAIDDVRYTLPSGYPDRRQIVGRGRDAAKPFSSKPFTTAEDVIVNVKIDYQGRPNVYLSHQVRIFEGKP